MKTPLKIVLIVLAIVVILVLGAATWFVVQVKQDAPDASVWSIVKVIANPGEWDELAAAGRAAVDEESKKNALSDSKATLMEMAGTWVDESGAEWTCEYQADTVSADIFPANATEFLEDQYTIWTKTDGSLGMFLSANLSIEGEQEWIDAAISADEIKSDEFGTLTKQ